MRPQKGIVEAMTSPIGVAVIGAGMAGRSHAFAYRNALSVSTSRLPPIRLVAIADANEQFARSAADRYGYERAVTDWRDVASDPNVSAASVVVANDLHREIAIGLLEAGKSVLCEKPMANTTEDAEAMVEAAERSGLTAAVGFTFRRSPAICAIRERIASGALGHLRHFNGHYWCDYGVDASGPMSWRYAGETGSGALADIGSHLVDLAEFLCGPIVEVSGTVCTFIKERPLPLGIAVGHEKVEVSGETAPVNNEDLASFTVRFKNETVGTFSVSRSAFGMPNALGFEVFGERGAAVFDQARPAEFLYADATPDAATQGYRQVLAGPLHPYIADGLPMAFSGVGYGNAETFTFQARAFLEQVAGIDGLPRCASFSEALHTVQITKAIVRSAEGNGTMCPIR
jgi:predicted dehydrogenase